MATPVEKTFAAEIEELANHPWALLKLGGIGLFFYAAGKWVNKKLRDDE